MARANPKTRRTQWARASATQIQQPAPTTPNNPVGGATAQQINQILQNAQQAQDDGSLDNVIPQSLDALTQMSDSQLAQLVNMSKSIDMPYHLNDVQNDTQKFVFAIGLNEAPQVLQGQAFDNYLRQNNIPRSQILSRSISGGTINVNGTQFNQSPQQVAQQIMYGKYNYVGGKRGGNAYGNGTYFDMNGGRATGYGGSNAVTINAVLSPNARTRDYYQLYNKAQQFRASHPQVARATGSLSDNNISNYALMMGYNVITNGSGYYNVIDRSAIVVRG